AVSPGSSPATYVAGEEFTFFISVRNLGPADETGAAVTDNFPAELQSVSWTCSTLGGASCGNATGTGNISETVMLPAGSWVFFQATGTVQGGFAGSLDNTATVAGSNDSNLANDSSTLNVPGAPEFVFRDGFESGDVSAWSVVIQP
ncbi:MAG: DUF11 domain-containing protein, partial [Acidobacteriota bacterium]